MQKSIEDVPSVSPPTDPFSTKDIYLAAVLFHAGERLVSTARDGAKITFVFRPSATLAVTVERFYHPTSIAKQLFDAYRTVKSIGFDR